MSLIRITLQITPDSIVAGGVARLTATLPAPSELSDLLARGYTLRWDTSGMGKLDKDPEDPTKATCDTKGVSPTTYKILLELVDPSGNVVTSDTKAVTVETAPTITLKAEPTPIHEGGIVVLKAEPDYAVAELASYGIEVKWDAEGKGQLDVDPTDPTKAKWDTTDLQPSAYTIKVSLVNARGRSVADDEVTITVFPRPVSRKDTVPVALRRTTAQPTADQALWVAIRNRTKAIAFSGSGYHDFINKVLCRREAVSDAKLKREREELSPYVYGVGAYELLKTATEVFLLLNCGVAIKDDDVPYVEAEEATRLGEIVPLGEIQRRLEDYLGTPKQLPYLRHIIKNVFPDMQPADNVHCEGILIKLRVDAPCLLELIWSYWHEEGMLVQAINAISRRFQNLRSGSGQDPLAHLEIDPIRPLNNLLWGYIQDEQHRLSVQRRAYEYDHHYGLTLYGKAAPQLKSADSRSKFLEAYHNLLHLCTIFYLEDDDTTRIADAFPLLNALKETHLLLAQGAHNQFGDLPWTARVEMLMQEWLLARPEMREFLQSRPMVPYQEGWMAQVDTMKKLQGWTDVSVMHFRDLGVYGEQILLSVRYGDWIDITDPAQAANWARYWRPDIQSYIHAYRAVTGVDLTADVTSPQELALRNTPPSVLLRQRLEGSGLLSAGIRATPSASQLPSPRRSAVRR